MMFQKAINSFNALGTARRPFPHTNLAQPAAHASALPLPAPARAGQRVMRGSSEFHEVGHLYDHS